MSKKVDIEKELKKVNFNDLQQITPARVVGRSREWFTKVKINNSIWQLKWHYGVGDKKVIRYGYVSRYSNFPKAKKLGDEKFYDIDHATMYIEISKRGIPKITEIDFKVSKYTGHTIPMLKKILIEKSNRRK